MPSRPTLGPGSGTIPGATFFTEYETAMKGLWDAANLPLNTVGGTPDNVTATCDWPLQAGFVDGMKFTITWVADNTGPMTLSINGAQAVDVKSADGSALLPGDMAAGTRVLLEYVGGEFRVLGGSGDGGTPAYFMEALVSGTWVKPLGFGPSAVVMVELWGGGGAGGRGANSGGAGGGGGYNREKFLFGDLPATVPYSVAAQALGRSSVGAGNAGGNTTFGSLLTAYGGGGGGGWGNGGANVSSEEGGGGGQLGKGASGRYNPSGGSSLLDGGAADGGAGNGRSDKSGYAANAFWGGGGGGGGHSVFGGGGGGGGKSVFAGNGGTGAGGYGESPSGGGNGSISGTTGAAGAGRIRIWIVG